MFLSDLLYEDLELAAGRNSVKAFSEESIHMMLYVHREALVNLMLVAEKAVPALLKKIAEEKKEKHYQLFVETGIRSPLRQGDSNAIHYSAMDVFCDAEGKIVAFIADHYRGHNFSSYVGAYERFELDNIRFIVVGGTPYQTGMRGCPVFTLQHLLSTAHDTELHAKLKKIAAETTEKMTEFPWVQLEPKYNVYIQSFDQLTRYIDRVVSQENKTPDEASAALNMPEIKAHLSAEHFEQAYTRRQRLPLILNKNIEDLSLEYAARIAHFLAREDVTESLLIEICYRERYAHVADMLQSALHVTDALPKHEKTSDKDGMFAFIFSNQPFFNILCLEPTKITPAFYALMKDENFLKLVQSGSISSHELWEVITDVSGGVKRVLRDHKIKELKKWVPIFSLLSSVLIEHPTRTVSQEELLELLFTKNITKFFQFESVVNMYLLGELKLSDFSNVQYHLLKALNFDEMSKEAIQDALAGARAPKTPEAKVLKKVKTNASPLSVTEGCYSPAPRKTMFSKLSACHEEEESSTSTCEGLSLNVGGL